MQIVNLLCARVAVTRKRRKTLAGTFWCEKLWVINHRPLQWTWGLKGLTQCSLEMSAKLAVCKINKHSWSTDPCGTSS